MPSAAWSDIDTHAVWILEWDDVKMTETVTSDALRQVEFQTIIEPEELMVPFEAAFPALVWNCIPAYPVGKQSVIFEHLFRKGCRYVVAGGESCEQWHDTADELSKQFSSVERDSNFVMTTWHTDESEDDVAFFFLMNTNFDEHLFSKYLVLQVGHDSRVRSRLTGALKRSFAALAD